MPLYAANPFRTVKLVQKGVPCYLFGNLNYGQGNSQFILTNVAITSNVATVTVQLLTGPTPNVGDFISIANSVTSSGVFNVNRAVLTGVTITQSTGAGTLTFALTNANVSTTADSGTVICEPAETAETLTTSTFSIAAVVQAPWGDSQFTVPFSCTFPSIPTAATATLQRAMRNVAAEFTNTSAVVTVASSAYTAGPVVEATLERGYVYRVAITGVTGGTSPTVIAKIG